MRGQAKAVKQVLSSTEVDNLVAEKKELEGVLRDADEAGAGKSVDRAQINRQIAHVDAQIKQSTPARVSGSSRDRMASESKELEAKIKQGMPTREEMMKPNHNPGAIDKHIRWERSNAGNIAQYKALQRQLNPGDPRAGSVENLRSR